MNSIIDDLVFNIKSLEKELSEEIQNQQQDFAYEIKQKRIYFEQQIIQQHQQKVQHLFDYLKNARIKNILSTPVIWAVFIPTLLRV